MSPLEEMAVEALIARGLHPAHQEKEGLRKCVQEGLHVGLRNSLPPKTLTISCGSDGLKGKHFRVQKAGEAHCHCVKHGTTHWMSKVCELIVEAEDAEWNVTSVGFEWVTCGSCSLRSADAVPGCFLVCRKRFHQLSRAWQWVGGLRFREDCRQRLDFAKSHRGKSHGERHECC